jgi:hypothetical protein
LANGDERRRQNGGRLGSIIEYRRHDSRWRARG